MGFQLKQTLKHALAQISHFIDIERFKCSCGKTNNLFLIIED